MSLKNETASLAQASAAFLMTVLVMTGIYKVIAHGGWIAQAFFGHSVKAGFSVLVAIGVLLAFVYFSRTWTPSQKHRNFTADAVVGIFAVTGLVYLAHFRVTGAL